MRHFTLAAGGLVVGALLTSSAGAANIVLDYTHSSILDANPTARAAINAAALDISNALTTVLGATSDVSSGSSNGVVADFDFQLTYTNPSLGGTVTVSNAALPGNEIRIFVGGRNLGSTTLAQGGPGGAGFSAGVDAGTAQNQAAAVNAAEAAANANMGRGGGPVISRFTGDFAGDNFAINVGSTLGNLWFDLDTDNANGTDTTTRLESFWHYDHTSQTVPAGKIDLYSVALHEILHAVGFGIGVSWNANVSGDDWTGPVVGSILGTGDNDAVTGGHVAADLSSYLLSDFVTEQAPVMIPSLNFGERRHLTVLDAAFLRDIGWQTVPIPEPTTLALLAAAPLTLLARRRRRGAAR